MTIGKKFQEETKYCRGKMPGGFFSPGKGPGPYKEYPNAKKIELPSPRTSGGTPIWEAMATRRSERDYKRASIAKEELSQLLWASQGITKRLNGYLLRTAPSAGALYPVETYLEIRDVSDIPRGIYHYDVKRSTLSELKLGDFSRELADAALGQGMVEVASVVFVWTAIFMRSGVKYRERAYRYVYMDAGHIAQNLLLAAHALGLSTCPIGALYDTEINEIIGVDGDEESVLYMAPVGKGG